MVRTWRRIVSSSQPVTFGDEDANADLELRCCCLVPRSDGGEFAPGRGPLLYCSSSSSPARHALARLTEARPHCKLRGTLSPKITLNIAGAGKVLVIGLVKEVMAQRCGASKLHAHTESGRLDQDSAKLEARRKIELLKREIEEMKEAGKDKSNGKKNKKARLSQDADVSGGTNLPSTVDFGFAKPQPVKMDDREQTEGNVQILPSGVSFQIVTSGRGQAATDGDVLRVRYEGTLAKSGKRFDRGTINFRLGKGKVIRGWDEGLKGMLTGEKRSLFVPSQLGYGDKGAPPDIPRNADLEFQVQLLKILP